MLRKARISDVKKIKSLIDQGAKKHKILPRSLKEISQVIDCFFVYESQNQIVACCSLEIYSQKLAEIRSLFVSQEYERQGIGQRLVNACLAKAKKRQIYEVLAITDKIKFFEKLGLRTCLNDQYAMFVRF